MGNNLASKSDNSQPDSHAQRSLISTASDVTFHVMTPEEKLQSALEHKTWVNARNSFVKEELEEVLANLENNQNSNQNAANHTPLNSRFTTFTPHMRGGSGQDYTLEHLELMQQIVKRGGKIWMGAINKYSDTPLHLAYSHNNPNLIQFLIANGADEQAKRYDGRIPSDMRNVGVCQMKCCT